MNRLLTPLLGALAVAATLLSGCSDSRITASGGSDTVAAKPRERPAVQAVNTPIGERFASAALDDRRLGEVRGGLNNGSGLVVNFSFQAATYVNHNLTQNIVVPTITVLPGANTASLATSSSGGSSVAPVINTAPQAQVSSPALVVQSLMNSGMTSVVSSLGGGGITNTVSNAANNQLVQQVITANINITGLSQAVQQSVASTVMSRVVAANSQFR